MSMGISDAYVFEVRTLPESITAVHLIEAS